MIPLGRALWVLLLLSSSSLAWSPISPTAPVWSGSAPVVVWNPDAGPLGLLDNAQAIAEAQAAFSEWQSVATATIAYAQGPAVVDATGQSVDVDVTNFAQIVALDNGQNPIIFDAGREILDALGLSESILGFTGVTFDAGEITKAYVVFPDSVIDGIDDPVEFDAQRLRALFLHEFGHFSGLGHTVVNAFHFLEPLEGCDVPTQIPTMMRTNVAGTEQDRLHLDDRIGLSSLYPTADFDTTTVRLEGRVIAQDGVTPVDGGVVVARPFAPDCESRYAGAASAQPGGRAADTGGPGTWQIRGLAPATRYTIHARSIITGGSFPIDPALAGPDESYNGNSEAGLFPPDDPAALFLLPPSAPGATTDGLEILLNSLSAPGRIATNGLFRLSASRVGPDSGFASQALAVEDLFGGFNPQLGAGLAALNRFSLPLDVPYRVDAIRLFHLPGAGRPMRLLVLADPSGSGDVAQATLLHHEEVSTVDGFNLIDYPLSAPPTVAGGDLYVGIYDLSGSGSADSLPLLDAAATGDPSFVAFSSADPTDFVPVATTAVGNRPWIIRAVVTPVPLPGSTGLWWGAPCTGYDDPELDYVVYEGSLDALPVGPSTTARLCSTGGLRSAILPPSADSRFWLVAPTYQGSEGPVGASTAGDPREPARCLMLDPTTCPN